MSMASSQTDSLRCLKMVSSLSEASVKTALVIRSSPLRSLDNSHSMRSVLLSQMVAVTSLSPSTMRPVGLGCNKQVEQATIWSMGALQVQDWMCKCMAPSRAIRRLERITVKPHNGSMLSALISPPMGLGTDSSLRVVPVTTCTVQRIEQHLAL